MQWWSVATEALKWAQFIGGLLFALGVWLYRQRVGDLKQEHDVLGARSLKTQLEDLSSRVATVERRMTDGELRLSEKAGQWQVCIGKVAVIESQMLEIDRARAWLFERVTDLMQRRRG